MASFPACYKIIMITLATTLLLVISSISAFQIDKQVSIVPQAALDIVSKRVHDAIKIETRMGASLIRLHFHDCFVNGCDGSILLTGSTGEQGAVPNQNSIRGLTVIGLIKNDLRNANHNVSCADILAIAARDAVVKLGGPTWGVTVGRFDSKSANLAAANSGIPSPTSSIKDLVNRFSSLGLFARDLVALSGAHTVGEARCINFRARIYSKNSTEGLNKNFAKQKRINCPSTSGAQDSETEPLDIKTATVFDNQYFINLLNEMGLLHSDQQLFSGGNDETRRLVKEYAANQGVFFHDFANAMIKMGQIRILPASKGEIRKDCRKPNN